MLKLHHCMQYTIMDISPESLWWSSITLGYKHSWIRLCSMSNEESDGFDVVLWAFETWLGSVSLWQKYKERKMFVNILFLFIWITHCCVSLSSSVSLRIQFSLRSLVNILFPCLLFAVLINFSSSAMSSIQLNDYSIRAPKTEEHGFKGGDHVPHFAMAWSEPTCFGFGTIATHSSSN